LLMLFILLTLYWHFWRRTCTITQQLHWNELQSRYNWNESSSIC
jgi:hypothetical protein